MNKNQYRLLYNPARNQLMVVPEHASSKGGSNIADSSCTAIHAQTHVGGTAGRPAPGPVPAGRAAARFDFFPGHGAVIAEAAGRDAPAAVDTPACADPGPFVAIPLAAIGIALTVLAWHSLYRHYTSDANGIRVKSDPTRGGLAATAAALAASELIAGVINGASELLGRAFGDAGIHARSAVGVAVLPLDAPVEVEIVVEVA